MRGNRMGRILLALAFVLLAPVTPALAQATTQETLLDRILIEDLMHEYYTLLLAEDRSSIGDYWTDDGVLEANGIAIDGKAAIEQLYATARDPRILPGNRYNMILDNPRIVVRGDTATIDALWTGVISEHPSSTPRILEQGSEHSQFLRGADGRWRFAKRVIAHHGGQPVGWMDN